MAFLMKEVLRQKYDLFLKVVCFELHTLWGNECTMFIPIHQTTSTRVCITKRSSSGERYKGR